MQKKTHKKLIAHLKTMSEIVPDKSDGWNSEELALRMEEFEAEDYSKNLTIYKLQQNLYEVFTENFPGRQIIFCAFLIDFNQVLS